jgi:hypothetical protein
MVSISHQADISPPCPQTALSMSSMDSSDFRRHAGLLGIMSAARSVESARSPQREASSPTQDPFSFSLHGDLQEGQTYALRWLLGQFQTSDSSARGTSIRVEKRDGPLLASECKSDETIITVTKAGLVCWAHPYSEPGSPPFGSRRLDSLFAFLQLVRSEQMGQWAVDRFLGEPVLPSKLRNKVEAYNANKKRLKEQSVIDIHNFLNGLPHQRLSDAVHSLNIEVLQSFLNSSLGELGVEQSHLQRLLEAAASNDLEEIRNWKRFLDFRLLISAASPPFSRSPSGVHSKARSELQARSGRLLETLSSRARRYYAEKWRDFCMSETVVQIDQRLFFGASDDSPKSLRSLVTKVPLP